MSRRPIILVGLPGSGKSTIGIKIALRLGLKFIDSDAEIERETGMTIPQYFKCYGEAAFRSIETELISRLLKTPECVIALGGGAFSSALTRAEVKKIGTSVWLDTPLDVIHARLRDSHHRPLLNGADRREILVQLAEARDPFYHEADIRVVSSDLKTAVEIILLALHSQEEL